MHFWFSVTVQAIALFLLLMGLLTFLQLLKGCFLLRRMARTGKQDYSPVILKSPLVPEVSTIAVPPDASPKSLQFTRRLLDLHFGKNEVVVVLDGPSDEELEIWTRELKLSPSTRVIEQKLKTEPVRKVYESRDPVRVVVIEKDRGGPIDSWNAAVNASTSPVIGLLDPESEFIPEVLLRLIQPMLEAADETIAVCGGVCSPTGDGLAAQFGALSSLRAWLMRAAAGANRNMLLPFPGSALLVRRESVLEAGGFTAGPLELFVRIHGLSLALKKPYRIAFLPEPVSYARTPHTMAELRAQVARDQHEIAHAFYNRVAIAGPFGWAAVGRLFYTRWLRPILETLALVLAVGGFIAGWVDIYLLLLVLLSSAGVGMVVSMAAVVLREVADRNTPDERRMAAMFFASVPENFGYRQLRSLWLIAGFRAETIRPKESREGMAEDPPSAASATSN